MLKKIVEEAWSFTLYEDTDTGKQILSVLCGTSAMYETVIELNDDEQKKVLQGDVKSIAGKVREKNSLYQDRKIQGFKHPFY